MDVQECRKDTKMIVRYYELFSRCITIENFNRIQLARSDDGDWEIVANKPKFAYSRHCVDYDKDYPCLLILNKREDAEKVMQYIEDRLNAGQNYIDLLPFDTIYSAITDSLQKTSGCKPTVEKS